MKFSRSQKSGDLPDHMCTEGSLQDNGSNVKGCSSKPFVVGSILTKRCVHRLKDHRDYQIWIVNQANQNSWPRKAMPHISDFKCSNGSTQGLSSESARRSFHTCLTLPLNKTTFTLHPTSIFGKSFLQSRRGQGPCLTTGLIARIWWPPSATNSASVSGWEPKPDPSCCQLGSGRQGTGEGGSGKALWRQQHCCLLL